MPRTFRMIPATDELRSDVLRVARKVEHPPTRSEYQAHGRFGAETVRRRSGEKHWEDAVASLTGIDREEVKRHQRKGGRYRTTEEWLSRLRELSLRLGHAPTTRESNEAGINAHELCFRVKGKWVDVLEAAGIVIRSRSHRASLLSTTLDTLIEDVLLVSRRLGHPSKIREYKEHGHYPYTMIMRRLGGWHKVKEVVGQRIGSNKASSQANSSTTLFQGDDGALKS